MSQDAICGAINTLLTADTAAGGVSTLTDGAIFESEAYENQAPPLVVFRLVADPEVFYFGSSEDLLGELQVDVYGRRTLGSAAVATIAARVKTLLHGQPLTVTGYTGVNCQAIDRGVPLIEDDSYRIMQRYRLFGSLS